MASTIHTSLTHYFLLGFGFYPTHLFEVSSRIFLLGEETILEEGSFLSFSSSIKSYGCVALDPNPVMTILSSGYPKILVPLDGINTTLEPFSVDFMMKNLLFLVKEAGVVLKGKAIFIDTSAPSKAMLSSSLSFAILVLECILYGQKKVLTLEVKSKILIKALKKGLNVSFNYLDVFSTLQGGLSFGEPTAVDDGFIDHLPLSSLENYRCILIHLPLNPYITSVNQRAWYQSFSTYRIIEKVPSLRLLKHEETKLHASRLTLQFGEKTMNPVYYFHDQQTRTKLAYFALKNNNPARFEELIKLSFESYITDLKGLSLFSELDNRLEKTVLYLKQHYPSLIIKLLSKPFQGPLIIFIPKSSYRNIKKELSTRFYRKHIEDVALVNKSILSYKL